MTNCTEAFSYDDKRDAAIDAWLADLKEQGANKSAAIRAALMAHIEGTSFTLGDVMNELEAIKRLLRSGVVVQQGDEGDETDQSEPVDPQMQKVKAALGNLGNGLGG